MKKVFLFLLFITSAYSTNLSNQDILDAANFISLNKVPQIIQLSSYDDVSSIKTNAPLLLKDKFAIQGLYNNKEKNIYIFDIKDMNMSNPACINMEKFMKTGYMVHELTHYKQDIENIHSNETTDNISYKLSIKEYEAFEQQLTFWKSNLDLYNPFFKKCFSISSYEWYNQYLHNSKDLNNIFTEESRLKESADLLSYSILIENKVKEKEKEKIKRISYTNKKNTRRS